MQVVSIVFHLEKYSPYANEVLVKCNNKTTVEDREVFKADLLLEDYFLD